MKKEVLASLVLLLLGLVGVSVPVGWHFLAPKKESTPPPPPGTLQVAVTPPQKVDPKPRPEAEIEKKPVAEVEQKPAPSPSTEVEKKPPPVDKKPEPKPNPETEKKPEVEKKPEIAKQPELPIDPDLFRHVIERKLDDPDGEFTLVRIDNKTLATLTGKIKTLKIHEVNGDSLLDASGLEAQEIIVIGVINGHSTVKLNAPHGKVEFREQVNGQSQVLVTAPGGAVTFGKPAHIDGDSKLSLLAKDVDFGSWIGGTQTRIDVTLTRASSLNVFELRSPSQLTYRRADPNDPAPRFQINRLQPGARLVQEGLGEVAANPFLKLIDLALRTRIVYFRAL